MKKALIAGIAILGFASVRASAGELGIFLDKQVGKAQTIATAASGIPGSYDSVSPTGVGFRGGFTLMDLKVAELGMVFNYHPKVDGNLVCNGATLGKYSTEYVAVGVQADWKLLLNLHAGVDMRSEKLTTSYNGGGDSSTTTVRPWVNAGVGFSLPTPVISPFVRLEVAVPMSKDDKTTSADDFRKAMAPSLQVSLYGGIRF